jgi:hypothetical protein
MLSFEVKLVGTLKVSFTGFEDLATVIEVLCVVNCHANTGLI